MSKAVVRQPAPDFVCFVAGVLTRFFSCFSLTYLVIFSSLGRHCRGERRVQGHQAVRLQGEIESGVLSLFLCFCRRLRLCVHSAWRGTFMSQGVFPPLPFCKAFQVFSLYFKSFPFGCSNTKYALPFNHTNASFCIGKKKICLSARGFPVVDTFF